MLHFLLSEDMSATEDRGYNSLCTGSQVGYSRVRRGEESLCSAGSSIFLFALYVPHLGACAQAIISSVSVADMSSERRKCNIALTDKKENV